jgi:hypothetical protein
MANLQPFGIDQTTGQYRQTTSADIAINSAVVGVESGECTTITDLQSVSTTLIDIPGSFFTLNAIDTFMVNIHITSQSGTVGPDLKLDLYTNANSIVPRSRVRIITAVAGYGQSVQLTCFVNNTVANTTYKLRGQTGSGSHTMSNNPIANGISTITWVQVPKLLQGVLRLLVNPGGSSYTQPQLQALYDGSVGINAPDVVPQAITDQANILNTTGYKIYLGHNSWWYTNVATGIITATWALAGGGKAAFGAAIVPNGILTFK